MGSKAYKGRTCIYCLSAESADGDHVIARSFFLPDKRQGIPIVPACQPCNNAKSELEHYLSAVMPFGGRHDDSKRTLRELTPQRLAKNRKLLDLLRGGWREALKALGGGHWASEATVPFDSDKLVRYMEMVVRGLAWHHWKLLFDRDHLVCGSMVTEQGSALMGTLFRAKAKSKIDGSLADGAFVFEAIQSAESDAFTAWRLKLYGVVATGDPGLPHEKGSEIYVITCHRESRAAGAVQNLLTR